MKKSTLVLGMIVALGMTIAAMPLGAQQTIPVQPLSFQPSVDGQAGEWNAVSEQVIPLQGDLGIRSVRMRAGTHGGNVYFVVRWADSTEDIHHKPFMWDAAHNKYEGGSQKEDRFAIQFAMDGDYTTDWFSGAAFSADTWHWKAARTNPLGLAHDKMTVITLQETPRAYKAQARNGATIYIRRPSDAGDKLYTTVRYREYKRDLMPKYVLAEHPTGSVTDVMARGVWRDGWWTLELARKLDTGHADDVEFRPGRHVRGGLAVFNRSGDDKHDISETLDFSF